MIGFCTPVCKGTDAGLYEDEESVESDVSGSGLVVAVKVLSGDRASEDVELMVELDDAVRLPCCATEPLWST